MELNPDTLLKDRYRIENKLGEGGMGTVYLAYDTSLDTKVAIKTNITPGEHTSRQFIREAKLLASLRHSNLPRVTDYFVLDETQYLVMDYIPGEDLSERLEREGPQPVETVLDWGNQIGNALTYLHTQNPPVIHRDIKPSNIKITPKGDITLVDFGIAKATDSVTTTGARGLTPGFAPPEQYGAGSTTPLSDQYALAATLYKLLVNDSPAESVERMLGRATLTPLPEINPAIPENVDAAIQRGLAIQPEERFPNVEGFRAALQDETFRSTMLPTVKSDSAAATIPSTPKKSKMPLILGFVGLIGVVALIAFFMLPDSPSEGDDDDFNDVAAVNTSQARLTQEALAAVYTSTPTLAQATQTIVSVNATETPLPTDAPMLEPTPMGSGGLIAFVSNRAGRHFQIFTMRLDGSEITQLTFDEVNKSHPEWSPDGTRLLYVADGGRDIYGNDLGLDIWMINADGGEPVNLTAGWLEGTGALPDADDFDPAWSPDGARIAYVAERPGPTRQIYIMNADGSGEPFFATRGYAAEFSPTWSPDGLWLGYAISIRSAPANLFLRNGIGVDPRPFDVLDRIRETVGAIDDPAWSPDGLTIAFTGVGSSQNEIYLVVVDTSGADIFQLTETLGNKDPDFSPDSLWIVFTSTRDQNSEIYIMDSLGREEINISNSPDFTDSEPAWQPVSVP
ncbi:MAG: protein kinase [Chloroflexi bacterium]|nr:protein kinase [Chloroflexota bacterium]